VLRNRIILMRIGMEKLSRLRSGSDSACYCFKNSIFKRLYALFCPIEIDTQETNYLSYLRIANVAANVAQSPLYLSTPPLYLHHRRKIAAFSATLRMQARTLSNMWGRDRYRYLLDSTVLYLYFYVLSPIGSI
jgi:hypothetical protein